MIEKEDYRRYLSVDNGRGILLNKDDAFILERCGIDYKNCSSFGSLITIINSYIDDFDVEEQEELEEVLDHLMEKHYYYEVNK